MTTRKGKLVTLSMVYKMLNNTYYCGLFEFPIGSGKWYKGSYKPIISRELFDQVQKKMAVAPKSKPGTKKFDYTKLDYLKCGGCGSGITAQEKFKKTKKHGLQRYVYYHCTQSKNYDCTESYLREEKLAEAFSELLSGITPDEVRSKNNLQAELDKFIRLSVAVRGNNDSPEDVNEWIRWLHLQQRHKAGKTSLIELPESDDVPQKQRGRSSSLGAVLALLQKVPYSLGLLQG